MIRNLVIGSQGFIGRYFCRYLKKLGQEVTPFDIKRNPKEDARHFRFDFYQIDRVYFLAWDVGGSKYLYQAKTQLPQLKWNLRLLENVMLQLEKYHKKFMFASSQLSEEATVYGTVKRLGELWTAQLGGVSIRIWNAYGILEKLDIKSHVISDFVFQAVSKGSIEMMTDGSEWRQFTHLADLSRAFTLVFNQELDNQLYDASSYEKVTVRQVAEIIAKECKVKIIPGKKKGESPPATSQGKLPGWLPQISLKAGVINMIKDARELKGKGQLE